MKDESNEIYRYKKNLKRIEKFVIIMIGIAVLIPVVLFGLLIYRQASSIITADKPIIYLYPEKTTELSITLGKPENIACSYPNYENGWNIIANPNGNLIDIRTNRNLYSLFWEGIYNKKTEFNEGFVVKSADTINFLEEKLTILGLNEKESEEFIVYWLPKMQKNKYNLIKFASMDEINEFMPLNFSVQPDTIIRILMQYKGIDKPTKIMEQKLVTPERKGFVVVEWGGSEVE